jgi:methylenetetrahydrofolate dehydrogenase (NADP+)/methenyltetrahydrofolate cyclohydrolase
MYPKIIDGKHHAKAIQQQIQIEVASITTRKPKLSVFLVGDDPASSVYVQTKKKSCIQSGMESTLTILPAHITQRELLNYIEICNLDPTCDGILVQLPLPPHIDKSAIIHAIDPTKDIDGFHPINMGKLLIGETDGFIPCTPLGIKVLLERESLPVKGKRVVIIGRSTIVGKPLAALLMQKADGADGTVTVLHSASENFDQICREADILISSIGSPRIIQAHHIKPGAVVIDVGINRVNDSLSSKGYRLVGDVDFEQVAPLCSAITPVPGGVGPMTIAMLLNNTLMSYKRRIGTL